MHHRPTIISTQSTNKMGWNDSKETESYFYIEQREDEGNYVHPLLDDIFYYEWSSGCLSDFPEFETQIDALQPGYYKVRYSYYMDQEYEEGYKFGSPYPVIDKLISFERSFFRGPLIALKNRTLTFIDDIKSLFTKNWAVEYDYGCIGYHSNRGYLPQTIWTRVFGKQDRYTGPCKISIVRNYI